LEVERSRERTFAASAGTGSAAAVGASASSVTAASLHFDDIFGFGGKLLSVRLERVVLVVSLLGEERKRRGGAERAGSFISPQTSDKPLN
jgi:hypothetical protein